MNLISCLGCPEIFNQISIFFLADIEFSLLIVFKLWVVEHLLGNTLASEEPDTLQIQIGFFSEDGMHCQYVLSEMINSLQEAVHQVQGLIKHLSLSWILLIFDMIDSVIFWLIVVEEELDSLTLLVGMVDEESLVVVQVELGGMSLVKFIEGISVFLGCWFLAIISRFFSSCLGFGLSCWLFLGREGRFDGLSNCLDISNSVNDLLQSSNSFPPLGSIGHRLSESTIENSLEGCR